LALYNGTWLRHRPCIICFVRFSPGTAPYTVHSHATTSFSSGSLDFGLQPVMMFQLRPGKFFGPDSEDFAYSMKNVFAPLPLNLFNFFSSNFFSSLACVLYFLGETERESEALLVTNSLFPSLARFRLHVALGGIRCGRGGLHHSRFCEAVACQALHSALS